MTRHESRPALTRRQQQVLALVARGQSNKQVAHALRISEHTVEQHLRRIYRALEAGNRAEASAFYVRWRLEAGQED